MHCVWEFFFPFVLIVCGMRRFATELAGRKARRRAWDGLGEEMTRAGWFDS